MLQLKTLDRARCHSLRALIVEDNQHMRALLRALLMAIEIRQIFESKDGSAGLDKLPEYKPDFILTDLSMAPMNGIDFTRALRRIPDDDFSVVPVIMVTGHTEKARIHAARDAGVNEVLAKPLTVAGLINRIEEIIYRPRKFVRCATYLGPCRRRRDHPGYFGPWRRKDDGDKKETFDLDSL